MGKKEDLKIQDKHDEPLSIKAARKRTGMIYLGLAVAFFVIYVIIFLAEDAGFRGLLVGALGAFAILITIIFFFVGLIYLIAGLVGKEAQP